MLGPAREPRSPGRVALACARCEASRHRPAPHSRPPRHRRRRSIVVAVSAPDLDAEPLPRHPAAGCDRRSAADPSRPTFTLGPRDSEPVISPDGRLVVFLRAPESGPAQLYVDAAGRRRTPEADRSSARRRARRSSPRTAAGSPTAQRFPSRAGTAPTSTVTADAEPPRRITRLTYRLDGEGFVIDKPQAGVRAGSRSGRHRDAEPVQLTDEPAGVADPVFTGDGRLLYVRSTGIDELTDEIAVIDVPAARLGTPARPRPDAPATLLVARPRVGRADRSSRRAGLLPGRRIHRHRRGRPDQRAVGGATDRRPPRRLTDEDTVDVDRGRGPAGGPVGGPRPGRRARPGRDVSLLAVPADADRTAAGRPAGADRRPRVVRSFSGRGRTRWPPWWPTARRPARWSPSTVARRVGRRRARC